MSKRRKNTIVEHFITVETPRKQYLEFVFRLSNLFVLLSFLLLNKFFEIHVPDSLYFIFGGAAAGIDFQKLAHLLKNVFQAKGGK